MDLRTSARVAAAVFSATALPSFRISTTVPAGEDQRPMIEQCCEIVRKFNSV